MTFGERLKQLREASSMSQAALAQAAEIGLPTLKDYEGDRRSPSLEIAQRLAKALGTNCLAFDGCEFQHARQGKPEAKSDRPRKASVDANSQSGTATKKTAKKQKAK